MAEGPFAPGHLGELTQLVPFEMVDTALEATRTVQSRLRDLPSRVVVYLLLAACLFPETGYPGVWRKLTGALAGLPVAEPSPSALAQARRRIGSKPLWWLFDLVKGPGADVRTPGTRWRGLLVVSLDGTVLTVPDSPAVLTRFTKQAGNHGGTGYPQVRLLALVACGTRTLIDVVFGPTTAGETTYAPRLLPSRMRL
ncbi:transposase domain-containing protein [Streptomyces sp. NPDC048392]|uniref:transposase domain-containing protein n=1 Tax=Streptomyces sp. NPDC048392 TaxID=3365543 RepID=UPI00371A86C2